MDKTELQYCLLEHKIGLFINTIKIASTKPFPRHVSSYQAKYAITVGDKTFFDCKTIQCQRHTQSENQIQKYGRYPYVVTIQYKYYKTNRRY